MTIPFVTVREWRSPHGRRCYTLTNGTLRQLANLRFHVYWRDLPFYRRRVDKHG